MASALAIRSYCALNNDSCLQPAPSLHTRRAMLRTSILLTGIIAATLPACVSSSTDDELAGESAADGEDGKGDSAAAFTFYNVLPDTRACSLNSGPDCGTGYFVSRANRSSTDCGTGTSSTKCKVFDISWAANLPEYIVKNYQQSLKEGNPLLVRGELNPGLTGGSLLTVKEIWTPNRPEWVEGVFTLVHDNGVRCVRAPCPSITERKLNSTLSSQISSLDFDDSGADAAAVDRAREQLYTDGLIIVGYRYTDPAGGKGRTADKFFIKESGPQL